jgi:2'-5' RNA ligase
MNFNPDALETTIMIVAPHPVQDIAVPILHRYAPDTLIRVPAHLTVLYPFAPVKQLDEASAIVRDIAATIAPFDITMQGYGRFPRVTFMQPEDPEPIKAVFRRMYAAFPQCPPYGGAYGNELHPHMTVGEFATQAEQAAAILPEYQPVTFRAERLHILYGPPRAALPWITHSHENWASCRGARLCAHPKISGNPLKPVRESRMTIVQHGQGT